MQSPPIPIPSGAQSYMSGGGPTASTATFIPPSMYTQGNQSPTTPQDPRFIPPGQYDAQNMSLGQSMTQSQLPNTNFLQPTNTPNSVMGLPMQEWAKRSMQDIQSQGPNAMNPQLMAILQALMGGQMAGNTSIKKAGPLQTDSV